MKENELRIGNWVLSPTEGEIQIENGWQIDEGEEVEPIPLSEEWFVKFGYAVRKSLGFEAYEINDIYTVYYNTKATPNGFEMCFGDFEIEIKWVHKLQNIHFALTGEELQTDETKKKVK